MAGDFKSKIMARAHALGFDAVGIAPAAAPPHADYLDEWLKCGFAGEMTYMARTAAQRKDPRNLMPAARSVVIGALNYFTNVTPSQKSHPDHTLSGFVARYARGRDYHEVLREKLEMLTSFIRKIAPTAQTKICVDAQPILERELAQQAGIGFIGKSTMLISTKMGAWFFIGELLTDLELEPDAPQRNLCGNCTRCINACPTKAIIAPFKLDARRCISYLTIELKGSIPRRLRPLIGTRIFGCDECLAVCPWNRFARNSAEAAFQPPGPVGELDLSALLLMDDEQFDRRFSDSPIKRTRRRGLLRNVCVALGNTGDSRAVPHLVRALGDREPLIRSHAAWALGRLGGAVALDALRTALKQEKTDFVVEELKLATEACGKKVAQSQSAQ